LKEVIFHSPRHSLWTRTTTTFHKCRWAQFVVCSNILCLLISDLYPSNVQKYIYVDLEIFIFIYFSDNWLFAFEVLPHIIVLKPYSFVMRELKLFCSGPVQNTVAGIKLHDVKFSEIHQSFLATSLLQRLDRMIQQSVLGFNLIYYLHHIHGISSSNWNYDLVGFLDQWGLHFQNS